jgi:hypothetical protein
MLFLLVSLVTGCNTTNIDSVFEPFWEPFNLPSKILDSLFEDSRDGEIYHQMSFDTILGSDTVRQIWMAENLRYSFMGDTVCNYFYNKDHEKDYKDVYGLLNTWRLRNFLVSIMEIQNCLRLVLEDQMKDKR